MSATTKSRAAALLAGPDSAILVGRVIQFASQLVLVVLIPIALTPEGFVTFNLLVGMAALGVAAVFAWVNGTVHRYVHELVSPAGADIRETLVWYYLGAGVVLAIGLVLAASLSSSLFALLPWLVLANALKSLALGVLNMLRSAALFVAANIAYGLALAVFILLCFAGGDDKLWRNVLLYGGLDIAISIFVLFRPTLLKLEHFPKPSSAAFRRCFTYGGPLVLNSLAIWVISLLDRYLLHFWVDPAETAAYILTYQLAGSVIAVPMSFVVSITFPRILEIENQQGRTSALLFNRTLFRYFLWSMVPILAIATAAVLVAIKFAYAGYALLPSVAATLVFAHLVSAVSHFVNKEFELSGRTIVLTRGLAMGAVVNVALNLALIPLIGALGAALATVFAYATFVFVVHASREFRFPEVPQE